MSLLRIKEVAVRLGVGYDTALRLVTAGELPHVKLPGRRSYLVDPADVDALIAASKVGTKLGTIDDIQPRKTAPKRRGQSQGTAYERGWHQRLRGK